jgi:hypothetical protein
MRTTVFFTGRIQTRPHFHCSACPGRISEYESSFFVKGYNAPTGKPT